MIQIKKKIIAIVTISIFISIGVVLYFIDKPQYTLKLPNVENLKSINIENKKIEETEKIKEIIELLNKERRTTKKVSIQDAPVNAEEITKIDFKYRNGKNSTIFVYSKQNHFYIEQPYNGIYKITQEEFQKIREYSL